MSAAADAGIDVEAAFVRAENDMADLGLGLSIVDRAARLPDHDVRISSRLRQGSIVSIGLKRA